MRTLVIICAIFCLFTVAESQKNNVKWGIIGPYDVLLHREIIKQNSKFLRIVVQDVNYSMMVSFSNEIFEECILMI